MKGYVARSTMDAAALRALINCRLRHGPHRVSLVVEESNGELRCKTREAHGALLRQTFSPHSSTMHGFQRSCASASVKKAKEQAMKAVGEATVASLVGITKPDAIG